MSSLRTIDWIFLNPLLKMESGWVLDFSNRTFAHFFATELNVDIDDPKYAAAGTSKANRLRHFFLLVDDSTAIRTLRALWEYREASRLQRGEAEEIENAEGRLLGLLSKLEGGAVDTKSTGQAPDPAFDRPAIAKLKGEIYSLHGVEPHLRGYRFEAFLKEWFDLYRLEAREPFRLRGEQIDGSFQFGNETYLLEAKWHSPKMGAAELHTFHGKIEQKAAWTRGLFVSYSGFTQEGLDAFGRNKRLVGMDGFDIYDSLNREIPLTLLLERKIRRAAETGSPFIGIRELFP